jgi:hypothetical protein
MPVLLLRAADYGLFDDRDIVVFVYQNELWPELVDLRLLDLDEARDDYLLTGLGQVGGGSIDANLPGLTPDYVSVEAISIVAVIDIHLLEFHEIRSLAKRRVNTDRSFVIEIRIGHNRAVDLRF